MASKKHSTGDEDICDPRHDELLARITQPIFLSRLLDMLHGTHEALSEWTINIGEVLDVFDLQVHAQRTIWCDSCQYLRTQNVFYAPYCSEHTLNLALVQEWEQFDQSEILKAENERRTDETVYAKNDPSIEDVPDLAISSFDDAITFSGLRFEPDTPRPAQSRTDIQLEIETCLQCELHRSRECAIHGRTLFGGRQTSHVQIPLRQDVLFDIYVTLPTASSIIKPVQALRNNKGTRAVDKMMRNATIIVVSLAPIPYRELFSLSGITIIEYIQSEASWMLYLPGQATGVAISPSV